MKPTRAIKFLFLCLFFVTPLLFTTLNSELFEMPKMFFVYILSILITSLHLINVINFRQPLFKRSALDIPLLLFLGSQIISTIISVDPHTSIFGYYSRLNGGLLSIISYAILYWILVAYLDLPFKKTIIKYALLSGVLVAIYGILEHFGIDKNVWIQDVQDRVFSTFGQPNWLAAYLCILLPLCFFRSNNKKQNNFYLFCILLFSTCLIFTKSKTGILAALISLPFCLNKKNYYYFFIVIALAGFFFLNKKPASPTPPTLNITASQDIRKIVWIGAIDLYKKYPVFGTGVESFAYTYYWTRPAAHNLTSEWEFLYNKAHNEYINYLATTGTVGFLAYLLLIITSLINFINPPAGGKHFFLLAAYISILITNFSGFSVVMISLFFYLLPALANEK